MTKEAHYFCPIHGCELIMTDMVDQSYDEYTDLFTCNDGCDWWVNVIHKQEQDEELFEYVLTKVG